MNIYLSFSIVAFMVLCAGLAWLAIRKKKDLQGVSLLLYSTVFLVSAILIYVFSFTEKLIYPIPSYEALTRYLYVSDTWIIKAYEAVGILFLLGSVFLLVEYLEFRRNTKKYIPWIAEKKIRRVAKLAVWTLLILFGSPICYELLFLSGKVHIQNNPYYLYMMWVLIPLISRVEIVNRKTNGKLKITPNTDLNFIYLLFPVLTLLLAASSLEIYKSEVIISRSIYDLSFCFLAILTFLAMLVEKKLMEKELS